MNGGGRHRIGGDPSSDPPPFPTGLWVYDDRRIQNPVSIWIPCVLCGSDAAVAVHVLQWCCPVQQSLHMVRVGRDNAQQACLAARRARVALRLSVIRACRHTLDE